MGDKKRELVWLHQTEGFHKLDDIQLGTRESSHRGMKIDDVISELKKAKKEAKKEGLRDVRIYSYNTLISYNNKGGMEEDENSHPAYMMLDVDEDIRVGFTITAAKR
jgi:hypothetical protein